MSILVGLIFNMIFILFPSLLCVIYIANKQNFKKKENLIIIDISLMCSLFLIIVYCKHFFVSNFIIYPLLVLLLSFLYKRTAAAFFISIISLEFISISYDFNILKLSFLFVGNFIIYFVFSKNSNKLLILPFFIYSVLFTLITFINEYDINYINFFINSIAFYLSILLLKIWIVESKKILQLQNILKEYESQKQLKESLFKITHEIKNPLAVVKGYLSMINIDNKQKSIQYLEIINNEIKRTINLLEDFMQFSKIKIEPDLFDFNYLLEEIKNLVTPLFISNNISYIFKSENNITLNGDYNRLKQVIINLIKNSIEACTKNGKVTITCYVENENLIIIIKDNGIGMSNDTIKNLFTPFYTTKNNGTGLGICLSKEIIEAHKGKLVYSSTLGKGTTTKVIIPSIF